MTKVYTLEGIQELAFVTGPNELVRGATWVRRDTAQLIVPQLNVDIYISAPCTIVGIYILPLILSGQSSGSCVLDIWRKTFGSYPPTVSDTIFSGGKPTISSGISYSDTALAHLPVPACAIGDVLRFNVDSTSNFTRISIFLIMRQTQ